LKEVDAVKIPYQNGFALPSFEKQNRQIIDLKGTWKKQRFTASDAVTLSKRDAAGYQNLLNEAANRHLPSYDDAAWQTKTIPSVENQMYAFPTVPEYYEDGVWYRRSFSVDAANSGKFVKLMFYSVNYVADVWLNGVYLGYHEGGYTPFAFDVSSALIYGGENKLVVRVDNPAWGTRNDIVPHVKCDWFNYTGIIHDVYLEVSAPVSVIRTNVIPQDINGKIQTTIVVNNTAASAKNVTVSVDVYKANVNASNINTENTFELIGSPVAVTGTTQNTITIPMDSLKVLRTNLTIVSPELWSPKNPNLYIMKVTIKENGAIIDEYYTQFGIRTIKTLVDKVYLNDKPVFFTGIARHEDHPDFGRSMPLDKIYEDMVTIKSLNVNMLRTAHYPNHLYTYLLADRLGIAIVEEIPVWWFDTSISWVIQNSSRHITEQMFKEMVFKDYNRPSVLLWSTCNECLDTTNRKTYITKVHQDLDFNYPDGRLITESAAADRPGPFDPTQTACDVAGWTMYFGIFHGGTYYEGTRLFLNNANYYHPEKPVLDTEFGYWSGEMNIPAGQANQVTVFNETFKAFTYRASVIKPDGTYRDGGYLMGVTWWCIFDWYSSQHPDGYQSMGIIKMKRDSLKQAATVLKNAYAPYYNIGGTVTTSVDENRNTSPDHFAIEQNYPNPFNPETKISFQLPEKQFITIKVYNVLGKEIATLANGYMDAGKHEVSFNAEKLQLSSGIYYYRAESGKISTVRKMIFLK
ncbi:MAG: T9SS type A sorting domain-containing protein, partial [Ignavibacteriales bacterium]|nr:T9SS type A sorting domain-containing protein [Ignavibacteriales bacterium]